METLRAGRSSLWSCQWSRWWRPPAIGLGVAGLLLAVTADLAAAQGAETPVRGAFCGPLTAGLTAAPAQPAPPSIEEPPAMLLHAFHTCTAAAMPRRIGRGWVAVGPLRRG